MSVDRYSTSASGLGDRFASMERRLDDLADAHDNSHRVGFVTAVKYDTTLKRWFVQMQSNQTGGGQSAANYTADPNFQSDWLPWQTFAHGTISFSFPPRVGMSVALKAPQGRPEMGYVEPYHNNPANPSTSDKPDVMAWQVNDPATGATQTSAGASTSSDGSGSTKHVRQEVSSNDRTLTTPGVTQTTDQSTVNEAAQSTMTRTTGSATLSTDTSFTAGNAPHELNAQLQGLRAAVTQNQHHIAALHDVMSKLNTIAITKIPQLAVLEAFLQSNPANLATAAAAVLPNLENYMSQALMQAVAKLTNGFLGGAMSFATGNITSTIAASLSQIAGLAGTSDATVASAAALAAAQATASSLTVPPATTTTGANGSTTTTTPTVDLSPLITALQPIATAFAGTSEADDVETIVSEIAALSPATSSGLTTVNTLMGDLAAIYANNSGPGTLSAAISAALAEASTLTADAASIDTAALSTALAPVSTAFSGAAASSQVQNLLGQISGTAGSASGLLSGLAGMVDAQADIITGTIKSYHLGGYGTSS